MSPTKAMTISRPASWPVNQSIHLARTILSAEPGTGSGWHCNTQVNKTVILYYDNSYKYGTSFFGHMTCKNRPQYDL